MAYDSVEKRRAYEKKWRSREAVKKKRQQYLEDTKDKRKNWAANYYQKNKNKINKSVAEYRKSHPEKVITWRQKRKTKEISRSRKDRKKLKPFYVKSLIVTEKSGKTITEKKKEVVIYRIKKVLKATK